MYMWRKHVFQFAADAKKKKKKHTVRNQECVFIKEIKNTLEEMDSGGGGMHIYLIYCHHM